VGVSADAGRAGGPGIPARPLALPAGRTARRLAADRWAARVVATGGLVVIAAILAIVVVIAAEVYPLVRSARGELLARHALAAPGPPAWRPVGGPGVVVDEYRELVYLLDAAGALRVLSLATGRSEAPVPVPGVDGSTLTAVARAGHRLLAGTADGRVIPVEPRFEVAFPAGRRTVAARPVFGEPALLDPEGRRPLRHLAFAPAEGGPVTAGQVGPAQLVIETVVERKALVGPSRREAARQVLVLPVDGEITRLAMDGRGDDLFAGTSRGEIVRVDLRDRASPAPAETVQAAAPGAAITALELLLGDRTLVVGDRTGGVSTWQVIPPPGGGDRRLARINTFRGHGGPVVSITVSQRDKGFVTADAGGAVLVHYGTTGATLLALQAPPAGAPLHAAVLAPRGDGLVGVDAAGGVAHWRLDNPHPEITWRALFGRVWYEGYSRPDRVWQSTGGTDDFEAKFSLTPLVFGTLKGTAYALLFAVPLALLAAVYVSEFMHPDLKAYVKPIVEIMAALPSVVLGFLAGLWLAPMVERIVPGLFLAPLAVPACVLVALLLWRLLPAPWRGRRRAGTEVALLIPAAAGGLALAVWAGAGVEAALLGGSYRTWLLSALGLTYDQRNSLVVGVAMGFAVIPLIFTIAEDSLANVPGHLRAGSLALGATRWQTALRIVLPTASPGIFSAVMIGFGRAVGETMIVLMATGNTPVMDWSAFNGFRALSANIAVELPEAPEGGTLFRVLFLAALLLFAMTFVVNTAAELVRLRLRRRFRSL
jgi:phosphate transport system permease protein